MKSSLVSECSQVSPVFVGNENAEKPPSTRDQYHDAIDQVSGTIVMTIEHSGEDEDTEQESESTHGSSDDHTPHVAEGKDWVFIEDSQNEKDDREPDQNP